MNNNILYWKKFKKLEMGDIMKWSDEEKEYLIKNYMNTPKEEILYKLEGRTWEGIRSYAVKGLGLRREKKTLIRDGGINRECKTCKNIYPQTEEYFYRDKKGFRVHCKECWNLLQEEQRKSNGALTHTEKEKMFAQGLRYCGRCECWKETKQFYATKRKQRMEWNDYHHWCRECESRYISARNILKNSSILRYNRWQIDDICRVIQYIKTGDEKLLECLSNKGDLTGVVSTVHTIMQNGSRGAVLISSKGEVCQSQTELEIAEFLMCNNMSYEKDPSYSEIFGEDNRKFDFKIFYNEKIYYLEFFGLYGSTKNKAYSKKADKKVEELKQKGVSDQCLFIYPDMLNEEDIYSILIRMLKIKEFKIPQNLPTQMGYMSDEKLLELVMSCSSKEGELPTVRELSDHNSMILNEINNRYESYTEFAKALGLELQYKQPNSITLTSAIETIDYMIKTYQRFLGEDAIKSSTDKKLKYLLSIYKKFTVEKTKQYYIEHCINTGSLIYAQGNYVTLEGAMRVIEYMISIYGKWMSYYEIKSKNIKDLKCLKYAYRKYGQETLKKEFEIYKNTKALREIS